MATTALKEALRFAPIDALEGKVLSNYAQKRIEQFQEIEPDFRESYNKALKREGFTTEQTEAINLYLAATSFTLASANFPPNSALKPEETLAQEAKAGKILFQHLTSSEYTCEQEATDATWHSLYPGRDTGEKGGIIFKPEATFTTEDETKLGLLKTKLRDIVGSIKQKIREEGFRPGIRDIQDCFKQAKSYCESIDYQNPPLWNLTLGNISWNIPREQLEEELREVPERLGLAGSKLTRIEEREREYLRLMERALVNYPGYQDPPIGWKGLIDRNQEYLSYYGLDGYRPDGSFISYGGADGVQRALMITRAAIRNEGKDPDFQPHVLFPTPGFTMIADQAANLGMKPVELVTRPEDGFVPTAKDIITKLSDDPSIRILILTPINNPGSRVARPEEIMDIYNILEEYQKETGIKITVINDLAYLGTGDEAANMSLARAIKKYHRRWDIIPSSTKILQEPGLRCSGAFTPDKDLAKYMIPALRSDALALSFPMQARTLATFDFVSIEDIRAGMDAYLLRQNQMIEVLKTRPDIFNVENPIVKCWDAALYTFIELKDNIDPVDVMLSGLFLSPDISFLFPGSKLSKRYIRAAIGLTPMTKQTIERMKSALKNTDLAGNDTPGNP